jgi:Tfp pilus assembly protein PilE
MLFSASPIALVVVSILISIAQATWQLTSLVTHEMADATAVLSNTSLAFTLERGSVQTACYADWVQYPTAAVPTGWTKCADVMLRFRIESFSSSSSFTLEVVEVNQKSVSLAIHFTVFI